LTPEAIAAEIKDDKLMDVGTPETYLKLILNPSNFTPSRRVFAEFKNCFVNYEYVNNKSRRSEMYIILL